jgi:serine protease Do
MLNAVKRLLIASGAVFTMILSAPRAFGAAPGLPPLPEGDDGSRADEADDPGQDDDQVAPSPLPGPRALPRASGQAPAPTAPPPQAVPAATPQQVYEHVRRGLVGVLRNGSPVTIGTVLSGDGRILTALSGLGGASGADVRYADGTTVHAKVGRSDKSLDLALLVPESLRWKDGLTASEAPPAGLDLRAMLPGPHWGALGPAGAALKGPVDARAMTGELLHMLQFDVHGAPIAGAPLLDPAGAVVAVLVRACKGAAAAAVGAQAPPPADCQPVVVGAPISAIRAFLAPMAASAVAASDASPAAGPVRTERSVAAPVAPAPSPTPWLGVRVQPETGGAVRGLRVSEVAPGSPAEQAGLKPGADILVAVDGQPLVSGETLAAAIAKHVPGETAKLLVFGATKFRDVSVVLRQAR